MVDKEKSKSGKREYFLVSKSKDLADYPPTSNCVRSSTQLTGFYVIELEPGICEVHFFIEADLQISMFIAKQVVPRSSNYANFIREYINTI